MSSRASGTLPKKRKRASENSLKSEPEAKKIRRNKSLNLEKDHSIEISYNKRKSSENAGKINQSTDENYLEKNQSCFKTGSGINNKVPPTILIPSKNIKVGLVSSIASDFADLSAKINSQNFKKLRDLRVLLDRTVVDNYFKTRLLSKKVNPQNRSRRRIRRSKKIDSADDYGQKTLFHFYNFDLASSKNPMNGNKAMVSLIPFKQENITFGSLIHIDKMKVERVSISMKDLEMMCDVKVNLERLYTVHDGIKIENKTILSANGNYYDPANRIKMETADDVPIDESLAKIKIEDVSSPMKMEVSEESFNEMNVSWGENCQPGFSQSELEQVNAVKITDAISALSDDRLLSFYDKCPDVLMEEITKNGNVKKVSGTFDTTLVNGVCSLNSSRQSGPVSDESGIFMSDDSTNFNEISGKFIVNSSFNSLVGANEVSSTNNNTSTKYK